MRKKTILLSMLLPLAALIAACSGQEDITTEQPPQLPETQLRPMTFRAGESQTQTRAGESETPITGDMYHLFLCGKHTPDGTNEEVTENIPFNTLLEWQGGDFIAGKYVARNCFWPKSGTMDFFAYTTLVKNGVAGINASLDDEGHWQVHFPKGTIVGSDNIMYALPSQSDCKDMEEPELHFKHTTNRIVFTLSNKGVGIKNDKKRTVVINKITIEGLKSEGNLKVVNENTYEWDLKGENSEICFELDGTFSIDKINKKDNAIFVAYLPTGQTLEEVTIVCTLYDEKNSLVESEKITSKINGGLYLSPVSTTLEFDSQKLIDAVFEGQRVGTIIQAIIEENGLPE